MAGMVSSAEGAYPRPSVIREGAWLSATGRVRVVGTAAARGPCGSLQVRKS
jgi:hypothetical protein